MNGCTEYQDAAVCILGRHCWWLFEQATAQNLLTLIDGSLTYIRELSPRDQPGTMTHHHGEQDHQAYLERPFLHARAAIHRRMHELQRSTQILSQRSIS